MQSNLGNISEQGLVDELNNLANEIVVEGNNSELELVDKLSNLAHEIFIEKAKYIR